MRKVKAAALVLCIATAGLLGGFTVNDVRNIPAAGTLRYETLEMTRQEVLDVTEGLTSPSVNEEPDTSVDDLRKEADALSRELLSASSIAEGTGRKTVQSAKPSASPAQEPKKAEGRPNVTPAVTTSGTGHTTTAATTTTTTTAATTTTTTTAITTTTTTTTTETTTTTTVTAADTTQETLETTTSTTSNGYAVSVTEREYIMLCNVVGHEYGADFVPEAEKALVVEVIMNRVNSPLFPNTIYEVLTQKNQFSGIEYYIELPEFSNMVTDSVKAAVDLYLTDPSQFQHGYYFFNGDGTRNYFRGL